MAKKHITHGEQDKALNVSKNSIKNDHKIIDLYEAVGMKSMIVKDDYKNINRVFSIKGLNTRFANTFKFAAEKTRKRYLRSRSWVLADAIRTKWFKISVATALVIINFLIVISMMCYKYNVYADGVLLGKLDDKSCFTEIADRAKNKLAKENNCELSLSGEVRYKPTIGFKGQNADISAVEKKLTDMKFFDRIAYAITVNDKELVVVPSKQMAENLLEKMREPYKNKIDAKIEFEQEVEINQKMVKEACTTTFEQALAVLNGGDKGVVVYKVQKGDSLWLISKNNKTSVSKILQTNPGLEEKIKEGQEIKITKTVPLISVKLNNLNTDTKKTNKDSSSGQKASATSKNKVVKRVTGTFRRPIYGAITSRFGKRWGRMHEGIDIAGKVGQAIYAADGGTVIFAGREGAYGKLVKISHGGKYTTYYGHCKNIFVKVGAKVSKGQKIATIGTTGRTTGPHLHFEIRKNGTPINPRNLLK